MDSPYISAAFTWRLKMLLSPKNVDIALLLVQCKDALIDSSSLF
jgi:hypothetical protein